MGSTKSNWPWKVVFFDLDGTLLDSLPGIQYSAEEAFTACGLLAMNGVDLRSLIGPPIRTILSRMSVGASEADLDCLEASFRISYDRSGWQMTPYFAGTLELLTELRKLGHRLFVVSNKPIHISKKILEAGGAFELFDAIVTRDSRQPMYVSKNEMIAFLLDEHAVKSEDCLMVGDTLEDAESAASAGLHFCLMTHGYGSVPSQSGVPVALRLDNFKAFLAKLTKEKHID